MVLPESKIVQNDQKTLLQLYDQLGFGSCPYPQCPRQDRSNGTLHSQNGIKMPEKRRTDTQTYTSRLYTQIRIIFRKIFHSVSYIRMQDTKLISQRYLTPWSDAFPYNLSETLVVNASTFPSCVCVMSILAWLFSGMRAKLPSLL